MRTGIADPVVDHAGNAAGKHPVIPGVMRNYRQKKEHRAQQIKKIANPERIAGFN